MYPETSYGGQADKVKGGYLDVYEVIQLELSCVTKFDETAGIATTYMGKKP